MTNQNPEYPPTLGRRLVAEGIGTLFLLTAVVGSGIMGDRLSQGNVALALLANSVATGGALVALIIMFGPISGAHFNPAVTLAESFRSARPLGEVVAYVGVQVVGAFGGVAVAHAMFDLPLFAASDHIRSGPPQVLSEFVATFGLVSVVWCVSRRASPHAPFAVAAYITAAYWFTASTSFANPAVTLARAATDTFSGIRGADVPWFVMAQVAGACVAALVFRWIEAPAGPSDPLRDKGGHPNQPPRGHP